MNTMQTILVALALSAGAVLLLPAADAGTCVTPNHDCVCVFMNCPYGGTTCEVTIYNWQSFAIDEGLVCNG